MQWRRIKALPIPWYYLVVVALILGTLQLLQEYIGYQINNYEFPFSWYILSVKFYGRYLTWVLLSPLLYRLAKAFLRWLPQRTGIELGKIFLGILGLVFLHVAVLTLLTDLFTFFQLGYFTSWFQENRIPVFLANVSISLIQTFIFGGIWVAIELYHNYQQKVIELNRAQLDALLMQLQPHFLFNTLHSVSALVDWDKKAAQKMITQLGDMLRQVLQNQDRHIVSVAEEIQFLRNYLSIEQVRFQDRLITEFDIAPETLGAQIPNLLLQPLVENALKHGLVNKVGDGRLDIRVRKAERGKGEAELKISIEDNGAGFDPSKQYSATEHGLGLLNVEKRLQRHYLDQYRFELRSSPGMGCAIQIQLPLIPMSDADKSDHSR
ncbi:MAG: histidine kinase [Saprospiraceae bacterium]|nr:histidine kinase [Saprospiraceae bacterium]